MELSIFSLVVLYLLCMNTTNKIMICKFCNSSILTENRYSISGHLIGCKSWAAYKKQILTKKYLLEEYVNNQRSAIEIANEHGLKSAISIINLLRKYGIYVRGIKEANNNDLVLIKRENTNLKRYGAKNTFCKESTNRKEWEAKLLKNEGITNVFQRESVKRKIMETCIKKYGFSNAMKCPEIQKKLTSIFLKKYGTAMPMLRNRKVTVISSIHKKIIDYLKSLNIDMKINYKIKNTSYFSDIFLTEKNKIIEVNGDYWHANPKFYKKNDIVRANDHGNIIKAKDIWNKEKTRTAKINSLGYNILTLWEYDIEKKFNKTKQIICEFIK